eukprot:COSAG01_NODE_4675_length_4825_cov_7.495768_3_plen_70_part_00
MANALDPKGKFRNAWVRAHIFGESQRQQQAGSSVDEPASWLCDVSTIAPHTMALTDVSAPVMALAADEE